MGYSDLVIRPHKSLLASLEKLWQMSLLVLTARTASCVHSDTQLVLACVRALKFSLPLFSGCHGVGIRRCYRNHNHDLHSSSSLLSARAHSPATAGLKADRSLGTYVDWTGRFDRLHLSIIRQCHQPYS